jgi:hypothetical protein
MRRILLITAALAALTACERAKMGTRGESAAAPLDTPDTFPAVTSPEHPSSPELPANSPDVTEPAPEMSEPAPDATEPAPETPEAAQATARPVGPVVPLITPAGARTYTPGMDGAVATCQGEDCAQPLMTDAGKYVTEQALRFQPKTRKLEILFVLDTSASMRDEHEKISREIGRFIAELSPDVSFNIGVLLGHGPRTGAAGVKVGHLYTRDNEPLVIKSEDILNEVKRDSRLVGELQSRGVQGRDLDREQRKQAAGKVAEALKHRLHQLPIDRSNAQGEAGLLNLYKALAGPRENQALRHAGLLQDDAALLVVFVADEQDICFDYAAASAAAGRQIVGSYASERDRAAETGAFNAADTCGQVALGERLTPQHVVSAARAAKGEMPVIFTGIHYWKETLPRRDDKFAGDNEEGRGYLDVIKLADGQAVDLGTEDFGKILSQIGEFSNFRMKYEDTFEIPGRVDTGRLDPMSIDLIIKSSTGQDHPILRGNVRTRVNERTRNAEVIVNYEALEFAYKQGWIDEGSKLIIHYGYKDESR